MDERALLRQFFAAADTGGVIALPPDQERYDQDEGHHEARELVAQRGIADPSWLFWHRQAAEAFDAQGQLTSVLRIHWGGGHARVAAVLAGLPEPFQVVDTGPGGFFEIISTQTAVRAATPFPDVTDTPATKARIKLIASRPEAERTPASGSGSTTYSSAVTARRRATSCATSPAASTSPTTRSRC